MTTLDNLALCGSHRSGKTTLAIALSQKIDIPFIPIDASSVFLQYKFSPSDSLDIRTRLFLQQKILEKAENIWSKQSGSFICDRSPFDMAAYLLADVTNGELDQHTQDEIMGYLDNCDAIAKQYFNKIVLTPPAIPLVKGQYKAAINKPLIHKLHCLILGRLSDLGMNYQLLPKTCLGINDRVAFVEGFWRQDGLR